MPIHTTNSVPNNQTSSHSCKPSTLGKQFSHIVNGEFAFEDKGSNYLNSQETRLRMIGASFSWVFSTCWKTGKALLIRFPTTDSATALTFWSKGCLSKGSGLGCINYFMKLSPYLMIHNCYLCIAKRDVNFNVLCNYEGHDPSLVIRGVKRDIVKLPFYKIRCL